MSVAESSPPRAAPTASYAGGSYAPPKALLTQGTREDASLQADGAVPFVYCTLADARMEERADWRSLGVEVYTGQPDTDPDAYQKLYGDGRYVRKKVWETTHLTYGLRALGLLDGDAVGLGVGCGVEPMLYHLARRTSRLYATDMYGFGWVSAQLDMLHHPENYAPYEYPRERLTMLQMNATQLLLPNDTVDFVYSVSSIEHFGGMRVALAHIREAARILKPGGILAFSTEFILQQSGLLPASLNGFFTRTTLEWLIVNSGLERIGSLHLTPDPSLLTEPAEIQLPEWHILREHYSRLSSHLPDVTFTDVTLFLRKPSR